MIDFEHAMKDPQDCFERPSDVLEQEDLSQEQKLKILRQWENEVRLRQVATEENMPPASAAPDRLAEINRALETLGETGGSHPGDTKFG